MTRFFVRPEQIQGDTVVLDPDDAHHLRTVLHAQPGHKLHVLDGSGREWPAALTELGKTKAQARLGQPTEPQTEPPVAITVAQALPKMADKMEQVLQRGTEIGASGFWAFASERSLEHLTGERQAKRMVRWNAIVKTAAEQSHRAKLPALRVDGGLADVLADAGRYSLALLADEGERTTTLREALEAFSPPPPPPPLTPGGEPERTGQSSPVPPELGVRGRSCLLIVGPEGGFTDGEVKAAHKAGVRSVSLGPRILRTETAALVMVSQILYAWEQALCS